MNFAAVIVCIANLLLPASVNALVVPQRWKLKRGQRGCFSLRMGLYDSPLPPRPSPGEPPGDDAEDDEMEEMPKTRLFKMKRDGFEMDTLIPALKRPSITGGPIYREQDPKVLNLVRSLGVSWEDAAWALEAYEGDLEEAWVVISMEQRRKLEDLNVQEPSSVDWDGEFAQLMERDNKDDILPVGKDGIKDRAQEQMKRGVKDFFTPSKKTGVQDWLPTKNPQPDEDEPWFTG